MFPVDNDPVGMLPQLDPVIFIEFFDRAFRMKAVFSGQNRYFLVTLDPLGITQQLKGGIRDLHIVFDNIFTQVNDILQ